MKDRRGKAVIPQKKIVTKKKGKRIVEGKESERNFLEDKEGS